MKKEMLINVLQPEECRIAILEDGILEELYVERSSHESYVGNIYKGRIVNIEPSIQAAFVDFGVGRNGFLHVSDVEPAYYRHLEGGRSGERGERGERRRGRDRFRDGDRPPRRHEREPEESATPEIESAPPIAEAAPPAFGADLLDAGDQQSQQRHVQNEEGLDQLPAEKRREGAETDEPRRGRRRSRGGSRRRRSPEGETRATPNADDASPPINQEPDAEPPVMGSAEHRTSEPSEGPRSTPEIASSASGSASVDDDLLFFPKSTPSVSPAPLSPPSPPPVVEPESVEEPELIETVEPEESPPPFVPPRRPMAPRGGSIEEDLAADLAAAEVGADTVAPQFDDDIAEGYGGPFDDAASPPAEFQRERGPRRERRGRDDRGPRGERRGRESRRRPPGRPGTGRPKPLIQDIFKRGQEVIVQVIKEGIGTKGPTLSTYISIAGRYLVLMPGLGRTGVSRKIDDEEQRRRLRDMFNELKPPPGLGFIMRTAAVDRQKKELQRDLAYLSRLWQVMVKRIKKLKAPAEIYQESDMITRTIRDTFTSDIDSIIVDGATAYEQAKEFLEFVMPRYADRIKLYDAIEPLFHKYGLEDEIARIHMKKVPLPNGGSIVIEQTEALVAIDVNSGNFRADNNAEETAYQMNLHAAKEIARQLRLRDLGGVIVNDFIDMREDRHRRNVERALRDAMRRDRARTKVLRISQFGIIEMTRQRIRPSLKRSVYQDCPYCQGMAQVKTCESMSIEVMRMLQLAAHRNYIRRVDIAVAASVADYLLNKKRAEIVKLEEAGQLGVQIRGEHDVPPEKLGVACFDNHGNEVKLFPSPEPLPRRR